MLLNNFIVSDERIDGIYDNEKGKLRYATFFDNGYFFCTCESFLFSSDKTRMCKHLKDLYERINELKSDVSKTFISRINNYINTGKVISLDFIGKYTKTGIKVFDDMFGGIPVNTSFGAFGPNQSGKSIFGIEFIYKKMKQEGGNALFIDTESANIDYTLPTIHSVFKDLYKLDVEICPVEFSGNPKIPFYSREVYVTKSDAKHKIYTLSLMTLGELFAILGQYINIQTSKTGQKSLKQLETIGKGGKDIDIWNCFLYEFMEEYNINHIMLDSLTTPVENEVTGGESNKPVRTEIEHALLTRFNHLVKTFNASSYIVLHEARSGGLMKITPKPKGGTAVHHSFKFLCRFRRSMAKDTRDRTMISLYRHQDFRVKDVYIVDKRNAETPIYLSEYGFSSDPDGNDIKVFIDSLTKKKTKKG